MNVPLRWLADFVESGLAPNELAHRLTMAGLEAEQISTVGGEWDKVYVGEVKKVERHPNADRLVLAEVETAEHRRTVVTGAPNIAAGQRVALALVGARLVDGYSETLQYKTLKPSSIRGVRSEGMVCSEKELGLSDEHEGILVLSPDAPVGMPLQDWLGDTVIELEITPNLVHAFSVHGIARETAALINQPLSVPPAVDLGALPTGDDDLVEIVAPDLCPRYMGIVIDGVTIGPSPDWLSRRLIAAGLRPINNVVDVTNYVMIETGQPLHAFDRAHLHEGRIVVRRAHPGETIETLDHEQRELAPEMLVIADADRAVAVAGVMGGVDSEVDDSTTTLLLEGANFDMKSVRHTRLALKLRTDASARFERGLDPNLVGPAMARATKLLLDLCPGSSVTAVRDVYPSPLVPWTVAMHFDRIERVIGVRYDPEVVLDVLRRLEFDPALDVDGTLTVVVPTFRRDVTVPEDVIEEVARIIGYESLPSTLPSGNLGSVKRDEQYLLQQEVHRTLIGAGLSEALSYVTVSQRMLDPFTRADGDVGFVRQAPSDELLRLRNPIQSDRGLMRPTLLPSLLEAVSANLKHATSVRLFELARVFLPHGRDELPDEVEVCAVAMAGAREPLSRYTTPGTLDYFDLKGVVEVALIRAGVADVRFERSAHPALHPGRAAAAFVGDRRVALLGELRPETVEAFDVAAARVCVAELDLRALMKAIPERARQISAPRFLPVRQDYAIVVDAHREAQEVEHALRIGAGPLVTDLVLFDEFQGAQIGEGKKSLAYRVTFTAPDRALTDADLIKVRGKIEKVLGQRVDGVLRA
ncbi:MAG: phenylalanine--tRNA ligase subunit beta [Thermomicrobiales bacterium]